MNKIRIKKFVIVVIIILLITFISFGLYSYFNKGNSGSPTSIENTKDNNSNNKPSLEDTKITSVYQLALRDTEQGVTLKEKKVTLKLVNKELYVNDKKVLNVKADYAQVTEQVIIFTYNGKCNQIISYVIDADGKTVPFTQNNYQMYDFRMLDGNLVAAGSEECPCNTKTCVEKADITFTYNGNELIIK